MIKAHVACAAAAIALVLPGAALAQYGRESLPSQERYHLRLEYREFRPDLTGNMIKGSLDTEGTPVDFVDDLAFEKERSWEGRGTIQFAAGRKLRVSYTNVDYHGDVAASSSFVYGGQRFLRNDRVVSTMKGAYYAADLEWDFIKAPGGFLGGIVGARMLDVDRVLVTPENSNRVADTWRQPQPVLGLAGRGYAGRFSVEGSFVGLSIGDHGSLYEFDGGARFHLSDRLAVMGGYRKITAKPQDGTDVMEFRMSGWTFGLELSL
jgi:hypothetical protein